MSEITQTHLEQTKTAAVEPLDTSGNEAELLHMLDEVTTLPDPDERFGEEQAVLELVAEIDDRDRRITVYSEILTRLRGLDHTEGQLDTLRHVIKEDDIDAVESLINNEPQQEGTSEKNTKIIEAEKLLEIFNKWDTAQQRISESSNQNGDITRAQHEAAVFRDVLMSGDLSLKDKDLVLREVFKKVRPERLENFISLLNGVVIEAVVYEDLKTITDNLSVPGLENADFDVTHSAPEEDVNEGFDYVLTTNTDNREIRILVDAKSSGVFRKMRDTSQLEAIPGADTEYIGVKHNQNGDRIIVVNPEGSSSENSTIEYRKVRRKINGVVVDRYIPSLTRTEQSRSLSRYYNLLRSGISSEIVRSSRNEVLVG